MDNSSAFQDELREIINIHSQENISNTPDFILAKYLSECLTTFNIAVNQRELWYGRDKKTGATLEAGKGEGNG